jgi:DNA-binding Lrp family transcriptional regulator
MLAPRSRRSPRKLQIARGTVQNRMSKLEREGVIAGYSVRLKPRSTNVASPRS